MLYASNFYCRSLKADGMMVCFSSLSIASLSSLFSALILPIYSAIYLSFLRIEVNTLAWLLSSLLTVSFNLSTSSFNKTISSSLSLSCLLNPSISFINLSLSPALKVLLCWIFLAWFFKESNFKSYWTWECRRVHSLPWLLPSDTYAYICL